MTAMRKKVWQNLKHSYLDHRKMVIDLTICILVLLGAYLAIHAFEAGELLYEFTREHEDLDLDELLLVILVAYILLSIFSFRRYFELREMVIKANTDSLLGIINRGRGGELIRRELQQLQRGTRESALIMFDIDHFKQINDTYGHASGDMVLCEVASLVSQEIREQDVLIRWGGEEFLILCCSITLPRCVEMAERLRELVAMHRFGSLPTVTVSCGVTALVADQSLREQIDRVDEKLYQSKREGRNRVSGGEEAVDAGMV